MKHLCALLLAAAVMMTATAQADAKPKKVALLVAIDHYGKKYTPKVKTDQQWAELFGTVNDISALGAELERRGFTVTMITNKQATHKGILDAFQKHLIDKVDAGKGDVALFHYSGHGQQIPDDNGAADEVDGYDESLVPFDNRGTRDYSNHIRDEALGKLVQQLAAKTPNVVISLDSCHSGTGTRGNLRKRGGPAAHAPATTRGTVQDGGGGMFPAGEARGKGYVLLSATLPEQYAREVTDPVSKQDMGVYTWALIRALRRSDGNTTYRQLVDQIAIEVTGKVRDQNPQLEGDADKKIFSGQWSAAPAWYKVLPPDSAGLFPIEAGRLHGLSKGATIGIYKATGALDPKKPTFKAEITKLDMGKAWAKPQGAVNKADWATGGRALELYTQHTPTRMGLLVPRTLGALKGKLAKQSFVAIIDPSKATTPRGNPTWDLKLVSEKGRVRIERNDGTTVPIPTGKSNQMAPDLDPKDDKALAQALKVEFRRRRVQTLANDDPGSAARVSLKVRRVDAVPVAGKPPRITRVHGDVKGDGTGTLKPGDIVQFELTNHSDRKLHVTILELSADGSIVVLYPFGGGENLWKPGESRTLKYPFMMEAPAGPVTWKVIATEDKVDFSALAVSIQEGTSTRGATSPLQQLMAEALDGTRAKPFGYAPAKKWGTTAISLDIK